MVGYEHDVRRAGLSPDADGGPDPATSAEAGGATMKRILVVDDDPLVSMFIRLTLEREGFETVSADGARPVYWCWIPATT